MLTISDSKNEKNVEYPNLKVIIKKKKDFKHERENVIYRVKIIEYCYASNP